MAPNSTAWGCLPIMSLLLLHLLIVQYSCEAWVGPTCSSRKSPFSLAASTLNSDNPGALTEDIKSKDETSGDDENDDEYEYVEYDILQEAEFMGSEWLVGTLFDSDQKKIQETWVRLVTDTDGKNVAVWGDKSQGTWNLDVASQFLSVSKENLAGKKIWAGVVDDYYFTRGTVRGWSFISPASVLGQWQARRLGVDPEEAGVAPWFEEPEESEEDAPALEFKEVPKSPPTDTEEDTSSS